MLVSCIKWLTEAGPLSRRKVVSRQYSTYRFMGILNVSEILRGDILAFRNNKEPRGPTGWGTSSNSDCQGLGFKNFKIGVEGGTIFWLIVFDVSFLSLYQTGNTAQLLLGGKAIILSFVFSFIAILFMMKWLRTKTFLPFVIYRIILGLLLILDAYSII